MSYELSDTERNAALQLNADYRFDHFISKLVEHEELFVLTDEHGVMMLTTEEEDCIPVWPHPDYAKAWAEGEWAECKPQSITLKVWLERWVDGMEQDELCVAVFPTPDQEGIVLEPADVADIARQEQLPAPAERHGGELQAHALGGRRGHIVGIAGAGAQPGAQRTVGKPRCHPEPAVGWPGQPQQPVRGAIAPAQPADRIEQNQRIGERLGGGAQMVQARPQRARAPHDRTEKR